MATIALFFALVIGAAAFAFTLFVLVVDAIEGMNR